MSEPTPSPAGPARARFYRAVRALAPLVVPLLAGGLLLAVASPLVNVLSLDYRALMESLRGATEDVGGHGREHRLVIAYEPEPPTLPDRGVTYEYERCENIYFTPPILGDAWTRAGDLALRFGALPLLALALTGLGLCLRARRHPGRPTLASLGARPRALLAAAAFGPYVAFTIPLTLALCVWVTVEVHPWLQWFDSVSQLAEAVLLKVGPPLLAGFVLLGGGGLYLLLRPARTAARPPRPRRLRRLLLVALAVPAGLVALTLGLAPILHASRVLPVAGGADVLQRRCATCHEPTAPLFFLRSPDEWRHLLESTCFRRVDLPPPEQARVLDFLSGARSFSDAWIFRTRCQRCHVSPPSGWAPRHPDDWRQIVGRVARYSPFYYDAGAVQQVVRHLALAHGAPDDPPGSDGALRRRVTRACTSCHFFSRSADAWTGAPTSEALALVRRMNERLPDPFAPEELPAVTAIWQDALRDPPALQRLVPHDRPALKGGLPW